MEFIYGRGIDKGSSFFEVDLRRIEKLCEDFLVFLLLHVIWMYFLFHSFLNFSILKDFLRPVDFTLGSCINKAEWSVSSLCNSFICSKDNETGLSKYTKKRDKEGKSSSRLRYFVGIGKISRCRFLYVVFKRGHV